MKATCRRPRCRSARFIVGPAPDRRSGTGRFDALFGPLEADPEAALDGVQDMTNMPIEGEPQPVRDDLNAAVARKSSVGERCRRPV